MLIVQAGFLVLLFEFAVIDVGENILKLPVIGLQNRILGGQVNRISPQQAIAETSASEIFDGVIEVVHTHGNPPTFGVLNHGMFYRLGSIFRLEANG